MIDIDEKRKVGCELIKCPSLRGGLCTESGQCIQNSYIVVNSVMPDILNAVQEQNMEMVEVLKKISSGMGGDLLGTTSLSREDMKCLATAILLKYGQ